jgi:23S rRNA (uracil1939-C5)-methyltransferase
LAQHGIETEVRDPHLSPPNSRRRAALRALRVGKSAILGFNSEKSHRIVDMSECHILERELFELVSPLRSLLGGFLRPKRALEVLLTLVNEGVDLLLKGVEADGLEVLETLVSFASSQRLARLSLDGGIGAETIYEPQVATVTLSGTSVPFPIGGFLQATKDGEAALVAAVLDAIDARKPTADLFSGIGTFALAAQASYSAEASRLASSALKRAAPSMSVEHRDLYRRPLAGEELKRFQSVILDPPRAGAAEQARMLANSHVHRIAYVSCNPATFARDAKMLTDGGYTLSWVRPVGQFRWSTHVELVGCFSRDEGGRSPRAS